MDRIESHLNTGSAEYQANRAAMEGAVARLRGTIDRVRQGGPEQARKLAGLLISVTASHKL